MCIFNENDANVRCTTKSHIKMILTLAMHPAIQKSPRGRFNCISCMVHGKKVEKQNDLELAGRSRTSQNLTYNKLRCED